MAPVAPVINANKVIPMRRIADGDIMLFEREIGAVDFAENQTRKFDIRQQPNLIKRLMLHVTCTGTVVTVGGIPLPPDAPFDLISNIQIKTSQGLVLKNFSALEITLLNNYEMGTVAFNNAPATIPVGAFNFDFDVVIPFEDWTNQFPERTILNTNSYNDLTLYVNWADVSIVWPTWVDGVDSISIDCRVVSCERPPIDRAEELLARQQSIDNVVTTDVATPHLLLPENTMIKTLMVITRLDSGARTDTLLDNLRVDYDSGNYVLRDMDTGAIQSQNKQYYNVENIAVGVYVIEFDQTHDFKTLFRTINRNFARIVFTRPTPGVPGNVQVFRRRIATPKIIVA